MEDFVEDYSFKNNFLMEYEALYKHIKEKFAEFISIGKVLEKLIVLIEDFCKNFNVAKKKCERAEAKILTTLWLDEMTGKSKKKKNENIPENFYIPLETPDNSSRSKGIQMLFDYFDRVINSLNSFNDSLQKIATIINDRQNNYQTIISIKKNLDDNSFNYSASLNKLSEAKQKYYDSINNAIKYHLSSKNKVKDEKKYKLEIEEKRKEYKKQIKLAESIRVEYLKLQGHALTEIEEFESNCTDELKINLKNFAENINNFSKEIQMSEKELKHIEEIDGKEDNKLFTSENKSLESGPKKNIFQEYSKDINYYFENFNFLKKQAKGLDEKGKNELIENISKTVENYLKEIIIEDEDDIKKNIIDISRKLKENQLTKEELNYLIKTFENTFNKYLDWKKSELAHTNNYLKVGEIYDNRFCYIYTFLGYFDKIIKTHNSNKYLNEENFNYFCKATEKILELNMNEDIDYDLCDLVINLSLTFYTDDKTKPEGKKYISEGIKKYPLINKASFWIGLFKFKLNQEKLKEEELESIKTEKEGLKEEIITEEKKFNNILAIFLPFIFNLLKFITDSELFNHIISYIFDFCKLDKEKREITVGMIENQIQGENISYIKINKDLVSNKKNL